MKKYRVGQLYPVWWDTEDGKEQHEARILGVRKYTGIFTEHYRYILKLSVPRTRRGWLEMAAE